ncbi:MAG: DNA-primase RepB domain-containing protein [Rhodanobacteraceae bacterium]
MEPVTASPLAPHAIVESSPNRWHAYWRVSDCPLVVFPAYQKALAARFDADATVHDLPRVLRLPGFEHRKGGPFASHIVALFHAPPYTLAAFLAAFDFDAVSKIGESRNAPRTTQETQETQETQVRGARSTAATSVARFIPTAPGKRNRRLFELVRHVKAREPDATDARLREIVKQWHTMALPAIGTADFAESWGDFMRGWHKVRFPEGAMLAGLLRDLDADPVPDGLPADYDARLLRLVRVCRRLQRHAGDEPFFLSARTAGDLLGVHFTSAANMLYALVADHVLDGVRCGTLKDRRASEYRMPERGDER